MSYEHSLQAVWNSSVTVLSCCRSSSVRMKKEGKFSMAQHLQAGISHCGTSVALWMRGHFMIRIILCVFMSQTSVATSSQELSWNPQNRSKLLPIKLNFGPMFLIKQLKRQLANSSGRSHSALAFSLLGYKGNVFMSQLLQPVFVGDLETSDGHPKISGGTSGLPK